ncbi:MAG: ABC transporter ATP-binding protein [Ruminococcus sp.]|nr:ABC transporter ATP-binding protein [Ruminococcus sp.]
MKAVETRKLTKIYKDKTAVDGIDLSIESGELFALLGVNGAGKTTTVRMLTCLSEPTSGEAYVCGKSPITEKSAVKALIGISPQETSVAGKLTARENLEFMSRLFGMDKKQSAERAKELISLLGLEEAAEKRASTLSGGWQRKLSIAMALVGDPEVIFLDEPTLGLDVLARRELWRTVEALKGKKTIILTTHYMEEAEHLADRIGIMLDGRIAAVGTLPELEAEAGVTGLENAFVAIAERGMKK